MIAGSIKLNFKPHYSQKNSLSPLSLIVPPPGCGNPGTPQNGRRLGSNFTVGAVVFFRCFDDFDLVGSKFRICQSNGSWSGTQPVCQPFNSEYVDQIQYNRLVPRPDTFQFYT